MKKRLLKMLTTSMVTALLLLSVFLFVVQTISTNVSNTAEANAKLADVVARIEDNNTTINNLTVNSGEIGIDKAKAVAHLLKNDPSLKGSVASLQKLCDEVGVDEIHVIDANGIITESSVEAYIGFDMGSGEQSAAFLVIIDDPTIEIAQEPQQNAAEGKLVQYIGVATQDGRGVIQVGLSPDVLNSVLASTEINKVLGAYSIGKNGYIFAIDKESGSFAAIKDETLVGTAATEAGVSANFGPGSGKISINGKKGHYVAVDTEQYTIATFYPNSEYYSARNSEVAMVALSLIFVLVILFLLITRYVNNNIVAGVVEICNGLSRITEGDYEYRIDVNYSEEFTRLSEDINRLVDTIVRDGEASKMVVAKISDISGQIASISDAVLENSKQLVAGGSQQEIAINELHQGMNDITEKIKMSRSVSEAIAEETYQTVAQVQDTKQQMDELSKAMVEIEESSNNIIKIISEINTIAFQTNLLSMNASIEAARAGEAGRGFAVVAEEVGALAKNTSSAAELSVEHVEAAIAAVKKGQTIAENLQATFHKVADKVEESSRSVLKIAEVADAQDLAVAEATDKLENINHVIEENLRISSLSDQTAEELVVEANKLKSISQ